MLPKVLQKASFIFRYPHPLKNWLQLASQGDIRREEEVWVRRGPRFAQSVLWLSIVLSWIPLPRVPRFPPSKRS